MQKQKQSKAKQSKAKQSKAKQSKASNAKTPSQAAERRQTSAYYIAPKQRSS
jgi:hypothetical protein